MQSEEEDNMAAAPAENNMLQAGETDFPAWSVTYKDCTLGIYY